MSNPPDQKQLPIEINEPDTGDTPPGLGWAVDDENAKLQLLALQMLSELPTVKVEPLPAELAELIPPEAKKLERVLAQAIAYFKRDNRLFSQLNKLKEDRVTADRATQRAIDALSGITDLKATVSLYQDEQRKWLTFTRLMEQNSVKPLLTLPRRMLVTTLANIYARIEYARSGQLKRYTQADFKYSRKHCPGFTIFLVSVFGAVEELAPLADLETDDQARSFNNNLAQYWQDYQSQLNQIERDFQKPTE